MGPAEGTPAGGLKYDDGKLRWDLLPWRPIEEVVKVYTYGARKYEAWNWYKGIPYSKMIAAGMRHFISYWVYGEQYDKENGAHHLASFVFYCLALMQFDFEGRDAQWDDRPWIKNKDVSSVKPFVGSAADVPLGVFIRTENANR